TPIGADPDVQAAVASKAAGEIVTALDVQGRAASLLGDKIGPLVAPAIARATVDRLTMAIQGALASDAFAARWERMVHATATAAIDVLRGDSAAVTTSNGQIYLNVLPAIASTLDGLKAQGIIDASVQLPDLSDPAAAEQAIARLAAALNMTLPPDFGQVPIIQTAALEKAQGAVAAFDALTVILVVAAIALVLSAVAVARDRRGMLVKIGIGAAIAVVVVPPFMRIADTAVANSLTSPGMSTVMAASTGSLIDALSWPLRVVSAACLAVALVAMLAPSLGTIVRKPASAAPIVIAAVGFVAVWVVIGPDFALLALALLAAAAWIAHLPLQVWGAPVEPG
ncbi:MAG TPA: hypothetical protein VIH37_02040, partial [Candidatus Limnocylindrales bacterium]